MLKAWNTGHPGGAATVHANDALNGLIRLESLVAEATDAPQQALIAEAVDLVVFVDQAPELASGRKVREVYGEELYQQYKQYLDLALFGQNVEFEFEIKRPDEVRVYKASYVPQFNDEGIVNGVCAMVSDITELKKITEGYRRQKLEADQANASKSRFLAAASHDAAGAFLAGTPYLFGGGVAASLASVQALRGRGTAAVAGQLPGPRSDLSSVTLGGTAYLIGGYDGASYAPAVLATTNGRAFRTVARLPVPVRYAAVAGTGDQIYVFGGQTPAGPSRAIQRVNLATHRASVVGHLPAPVTGATAFTLGGQIFIAGGQTGIRPTGTVLAYNPARHSAAPAGSLR